MAAKNIPVKFPEKELVYGPEVGHVHKEANDAETAWVKKVWRK